MDLHMICDGFLPCWINCSFSIIVCEILEVVRALFTFHISDEEYSPEVPGRLHTQPCFQIFGFVCFSPGAGRPLARVPKSRTTSPRRAVFGTMTTQTQQCCRFATSFVLPRPSSLGNKLNDGLPHLPRIRATKRLSAMHRARRGAFHILCF